jgi:hypothetical protein
VTEEEENNASQPPKKPKVLGVFPATADAALVWRKASTWLALASASTTAGLGAFALLPSRVQGLVPDWALAVLGAVAILSALLIPLATSIQQQGLQR